MISRHEEANARLQWWFDHLHPDTTLDASTAAQLVDVMATDHWIEQVLTPPTRLALVDSVDERAARSVNDILLSQ